MANSMLKTQTRRNNILQSSSVKAPYVQEPRQSHAILCRFLLIRCIDVLHAHLRARDVVPDGTSFLPESVLLGSAEHRAKKMCRSAFFLWHSMTDCVIRGA